ncbi:MAG: hypothetical protein ACREXY_14080 [Gammaproteobacteria bacterium]
MVFKTDLDSLLQILDAMLLRVGSDVVGVFHGIELGAAHGTEMRKLMTIFGEGFVIIFARPIWVDGKIELVADSGPTARTFDSLPVQSYLRS